MPRMRNSGVLSVVAFIVERLGEIVDRLQRLLNAQRLHVLTAHGGNRDADVLHGLAIVAAR
jgi:site-specific recombinase